MNTNTNTIVKSQAFRQYGEWVYRVFFATPSGTPTYLVEYRESKGLGGPAVKNIFVDKWTKKHRNYHPEINAVPPVEIKSAIHFFKTVATS